MEKKRNNLKYNFNLNNFKLKQQQFSNQFSSIYRIRINKLKEYFKNLVVKKWGQTIQISSQLIDSEYYSDEVIEVVIIGNIFKELKLRPSVLSEYRLTGEIGEISETFENYHSESDHLYLEDESGRILLVGPEVNSSHLVTGITVAVKGRVLADGQFQVSDWCHLYHSIPTEPVSYDNSILGSSYVLLVSGLEFGSTSSNSSSTIDVPLEFSTQLLADFVTGRLGGSNDIELASRITRVIIAGNSVTPIDSELFKERYLTTAQQQFISSPTKQLDEFLSQILGSCAVDLIPGPLDPTNSSLPQQPFNPCLLPNSYRFNTFSATTNPYEISLTMPSNENDNNNSSSLSEIRIIGHSGEPVDDIRRQTRNKLDHEQLRKPVDILSDTFLWGHICPTAPDTISAFPFTHDDPFIILPPDSSNSKLPPTIYFSGNQDEFDWKLESVSHSEKDHSSPLLSVCIPKFSSTREAVLINLDNYQCSILKFGV